MLSPPSAKKLSVTEIRTLIRDPYAIYAKHILRLSPLDPLRPEADPRLRGTVLHAILERFVGQRGAGVADLLHIADDVLAERVAWPLARAVWRARIGKAAEAFIAFVKAYPQSTLAPAAQPVGSAARCSAVQKPPTCQSWM